VNRLVDPTAPSGHCAPTTIDVFQLADLVPHLFRFIVTLLLWGSAATGQAAENFAACPQFFANGKPPALAQQATDRALCYDSFAILHSGQSKTPVYVAEKLNSAVMAETLMATQIPPLVAISNSPTPPERKGILPAACWRLLGGGTASPGPLWACSPPAPSRWLPPARSSRKKWLSAWGNLTGQRWGSLRWPSGVSKPRFSRSE